MLGEVHLLSCEMLGSPVQVPAVETETRKWESTTMPVIQTLETSIRV